MFNRRELLKSTSLGAGSLVLAPVLKQLEAHAAGENRLPKRIVFVLQCNGFQTWAAQPKGLERSDSGPASIVDLPLTGQELPDDLSPLAAVQDRVTVIQRLHGAQCWPHHGGGFAALAGSRAAKKTPLAPTIDAALAAALPAVFPIVGLGLNLQDARRGTVYVCSAWDRDKPIATQCRPDLAFQSLFGSVSGDEARADFDSRAKLLDFMKDDVRRVRGTLAAEERQKFDYYLNSFEAMSGRLVELKQMEPALRRHAPSPDEGYASDNEAKRLMAQFELAATALVSGLTNVVTICSGLCNANGHVRGLGIDINIHEIGHRGSDKGRDWKELYTLIRRFHLDQVAGLVKKLESVPEGDGTMMDNTLIVYTSDASNEHHASGKEWPFVLIGSLGGRLRTGRFLEYPSFGSSGNRSINALYCTLLHAAGVDRDHFNLDGTMRDVDQPGPLSELLV